MKAMDRLVEWNARQTMRLTIPILLLKGVAGFILAGFVLAILVPFLHRNGIALREWMILAVMAGMIVICVGPDIYRRFSHSRTKAQ